MKEVSLFRMNLSQVVLCFSLFLATGCSGGSEKVPVMTAGPMGKVHGTLKVDGKPPPEGCTIYFTAVKGGSVGSAVTGSGGTYSASNVPAGEVTVMVSGPSMKPDGSLVSAAGGGVPEKYSSPVGSGSV